MFDVMQAISDVIPAEQIIMEWESSPSVTSQWERPAGILSIYAARLNSSKYIKIRQIA